MKDAVWLACCPRNERRIVQREIESREVGARLLWLDGVQALGEVLAALSEPVDGVVVLDDENVRDELLALLAKVASSQVSCRAVVMISELDPAWIAQLFHAGAAEVVPASREEMRRGCADGACMERGCNREAQTPPLDTTPGLEVPCAPTRLACNATEAVHEPVPRVQDGCLPSYTQDDLADLDEPDEAPLAPCRAEDLRCMGGSRAAGPDHTAPEPSGEEIAPRVDTSHVEGASERRAPVICAVSGAGGSGVTTLIAAMAACSAHAGLRTAVLDLDLMFGNLYELFGVETLHDLGLLANQAGSAPLDEAAIVRSSMRVGPGLTLWGPIATPERAELLGRAVEMLIGVLRRESDVVFVDTSRTWTDAVAGAVAGCDRCLMVCGHAVGAVTALERAVSMVSRLGVPRTRMVCVVNRFGQRACTEEEAMRLEMAASLSAKTRIPDGGSALASLLSFGRIEDAVRAQDAFGRSIHAFTRSLLRELGCSIGADVPDSVQEVSARPRLRLPWKRPGEAS